jgi:hypothetical protein
MRRFPLSCLVCHEERRGYACERCQMVCCYRCYPTLPLEPERRWLFLTLVRRRRCPRGDGRLFRQRGCLRCGKPLPVGVMTVATEEWPACRVCGWDYCPPCAAMLPPSELVAQLPGCLNCGGPVRRSPKPTELR